MPIPVNGEGLFSALSLKGLWIRVIYMETYLPKNAGRERGARNSRISCIDNKEMEI